MCNIDTNHETIFPFLAKIRHYCHHSLRFMMAVPSENPVLAANLQIVLSRAPGLLDLAIDSLRKALLGTAAVHRSFLASRTGDVKTADDSMRLANAYRSQAVRLLSKACLSTDGAQSDATIAAAAAIAQLDVSASPTKLRFAQAEIMRPDSLERARLGREPRPRAHRRQHSRRARCASRTQRPSPAGHNLRRVVRPPLSRDRCHVRHLWCVPLFSAPEALLTAPLRVSRKSQETHDSAPRRARMVVSAFSRPVSGYNLTSPPHRTQAANDDDGHSHADKCFGISRALVPLLSRVRPTALYSGPCADVQAPGRSCPS